MNKNDKVLRFFTLPDMKVEKRNASEGIPAQYIVRGHAAVFNQETDICGWFSEVIAPGAFDNCDLTDVPLFTNHDDSKIPLARSRRNNGNSTMTLGIDETGLSIEARLDVDNNPEAAALYSAVSRGDITGMSFCFHPDKEAWDFSNEDYPKRTITSISKVFEVSAVNNPAYEGTDISARDRDALDNARKEVETARSQALDKAKSEEEIEVLKLKNKILSK